MRRQVRMMADKGVHAALPHPRFGMDRRLYLEEPFWKAMDATLDEAQKIGSSIWLYDEYNWPSGGAGGRVTDGHPEFYPRGLDYAFVPCEGPRDFTISKPEPSEKVMERFEKIVAAFIAPGGDSIPREPWGQVSPDGQSITRRRAERPAPCPRVLSVPRPQPQPAGRRQQFHDRLPPAGADPPIHRVDPRGSMPNATAASSASKSPPFSMMSQARWLPRPSRGPLASRRSFRSGEGST